MFTIFPPTRSVCRMSEVLQLGTFFVLLLLPTFGLPATRRVPPSAFWRLMKRAKLIHNVVYPELACICISASLCSMLKFQWMKCKTKITEAFPNKQFKAFFFHSSRPRKIRSGIFLLVHFILSSSHTIIACFRAETKSCDNKFLK